ncbi:SIMPL domain-containing protein [Synechococcus sp. A10-1-5-1]|uniref:SIMPL domain-containing protein n=1 Tax=Synechococcus sp. A10-1-5-1 TaxID=2936507 RepID=UPI002000DA25|nr:SIMPL domain-containing protein [Synechococcus sp. A10-1-5-1]UPM49151.1 SIMPL domain-containing protein [Synechococcus sp. A10-1-5-1]
MFRSRSAVFSLALLPALMMPSPAQAGGGDRCGGTLYQLQVSQSGTTAFDRFRFNLDLSAEAATKAEAMQQLNARLERLRSALTPLVSGRITIPAPRTYAIGGGSAGPRRQRATTNVSGEVSKANYDALIQAAGKLPGVNLNGFTSLAASGSAETVQAQLMRQALADGKRQAQATADALGLRRVQLLRINQRGGTSPRPVAMNRALSASFNPDEAPAPRNSVSLALDYCVS